MSFRILPVLLLLGLSTSARASDYESPRTAALGGSGHAGPMLNDALYLNPGMIALSPAYSISVSHETTKGPDSTEPKALVENATIQDGTNPDYAAGVGYTRKTYGREVQVGIAKRVFDKAAAGIGGKFLFGSDSLTNAQDLTVSGGGEVLPWLQTGVIVDNALESTNTKTWNHYREFTVGTKANIQKIMLVYFDPHIIPNKPGDTIGFEAGAEIPIMSDLYIRFGANKNSFIPALGDYGHGNAFGVGWTFPRFSLDAAVTRTYSPVRTNGILFSATIL